MNCAEAVEKLELLALDALSHGERQALENHLSACPQCRTDAEQLRAALARFRSAIRACEPSDGGARLRAAVSDEIARARESARARRRMFPLLRLAAALLLVAALFGVFQLGAGRRRAAACQCGPWQLKGVRAHSGPGGVYPLVCEKRVFVLREEPGGDCVEALEKGTGRMLWRSSFAAYGDCLSADGSRVFACRREAAAAGDRIFLVALSAETGSVLWESKADETVPDGTPVRARAAEDGTVAWLRGNSLTCLDSRTGSELWRQRAGDRNLVSVLAEAGGSIYAASLDTVYAFDRRDGRIAWEKRFGEGYCVGFPLLALNGPNLFVAHGEMGSQGDLSAFDAQDGTLCWRQKLGVPRSLVCGEGRLYVRTETLQVFDTADGAPIWAADLAGCGPADVREDNVFVVGGRKHDIVVSLDAKTGARKWEMKLAGSCSGIVVAGRMGFVSGHDNVLYAVRITGA